MDSSEVVDFYLNAKQYCLDKGFEAELESVKERRFEDMDAEDFFLHYVYVVLNSGMRNQVAERIYYSFLDKHLDLNVIGHKGKREAIREAKTNYMCWFGELKVAEDKIEYLRGLPYIGDITKHHLARNMGIDTVKPDRHLIRLADQFGYSTPIEMCKAIKSETSERLGVIDVILWRFSNLTGQSRKTDPKQKTLEA